MIYCRRATKDDVSCFKTIRLRSLKDSPAAFGSTYEGAITRDAASWEEQLCSTISGDTRNTQFAFDGDSCIGIAALYRQPNAESGDIIMMWVAPDYRGSAAATLLVRNLIEWATLIGLSSVGLGVTTSNERAIGFYRKLGFTETGERVECDAQRELFAIRMKTTLGLA